MTPPPEHDVERLRKVIRDLHHCDSVHRESVPVHEMFQGKTVWDGTVEVFDLIGHPTAKIAYAWSHKTDSGGTRYVAVLGVDPIRSAQDAVRAAVVAEIRKRSSPQHHEED